MCVHVCVSVCQCTFNRFYNSDANPIQCVARMALIYTPPLQHAATPPQHTATHCISLESVSMAIEMHCVPSLWSVLHTLSVLHHFDTSCITMLMYYIAQTHDTLRLESVQCVAYTQSVALHLHRDVDALHRADSRHTASSGCAMQAFRVP